MHKAPGDGWQSFWIVRLQHTNEYDKPSIVEFDVLINENIVYSQ